MAEDDPPEPPRLFTVADVVRYYEPFRETQVLNFARFVVRKGYRAMVPGKSGSKEETWQACGRRLFGEAFIPAMERALEEYCALTPNEPPASPDGIPDPDF